MNKAIIPLIAFSLFCIQIGVFAAFKSPEKPQQFVHLPLSVSLELRLKEEVFKVLDANCNICHRKNSSFNLFSTKNMDKYAKKIYKQVFGYRKMPKGDEIKLIE